MSADPTTDDPLFAAWLRGAITDDEYARRASEGILRDAKEQYLATPIGEREDV